jgi:hypothetical protein
VTAPTAEIVAPTAPTTSSAVTVEMAAIPTLATAAPAAAGDDKKIEAQLSAIKRTPKYIRSFFHAPSVAYIPNQPGSKCARQAIL